MRFSLDVLRARKGDCLMLHYGTKTAPRLIMIDGGPSDVYRPHLRPRIERIKEMRGLDDQAPLPVNVLMLSHVDDDHIKGILDLTKELRAQKTNSEPQLVQVASLWHNTFDDLLKTTPDALKAEAGFGAAALAGTIDVDDEEELDVAKVLASIPQGRMLRDDASFLGKGTTSWKINHEFNGDLILATNQAKAVTLDSRLSLTVIGPMQPELQALQKDHDRWLRAQSARKKKSAESALAAFIDRSVPNLSSLVLLVEAGNKRMLLTGDARGDKILKGLELTGLLQPDGTSTMHVDVLKVPHHGSSHNVASIFFERVTADHYVFSGNGEYGNPERETLEMLFEARGEAPFTVHVTYPLDDIDRAREVDWQKQQAEETRKGKTRCPNWSPGKHSLAAFFDELELADGQQLIEMPKSTQPHVIDLLEPLGF